MAAVTTALEPKPLTSTTAAATHSERQTTALNAFCSAFNNAFERAVLQQGTRLLAVVDRTNAMVHIITKGTITEKEVQYASVTPRDDGKTVTYDVKLLGDQVVVRGNHPAQGLALHAIARHIGKHIDIDKTVKPVTLSAESNMLVRWMIAVTRLAMLDGRATSTIWVHEDLHNLERKLEG